ncbi:toxin-antitoxin system YwqK family antitoxin [Flavobacterium silvaticum]|nr:membrane-binding protein [Flavobacterium silvaticum]
MKKYILAAVMMSVIAVSAHNGPKLEAVGGLVKATYYHDNGSIAQQGFFKDGKADGKWVAFDANGNKKSIGEYSKGQKTGKWFFWNEQTLSEVDYADSRVAAVKNWKQEAVANRN